MKIHYLSALKSNNCVDAWTGYPEAELGHVEFPHSRVKLVRHNIIEGLHHAFTQCDCLYTDVAWPAGMKTFDEYARTSTDYHHYLRAISVVFNNTRLPVVFVGGKALEKNFYPDGVREIKLNKEKAYAYFRNMELGEVKTADEILALMATQYNRVGDPCCGLGRTGSVFYKAGKSCVMSDYNGRVICYLSRNWNHIYGI